MMRMTNGPRLNAMCRIIVSVVIRATVAAVVVKKVIVRISPNRKMSNPRFGSQTGEPNGDDTIE